jgi:hypothetical protein
MAAPTVPTTRIDQTPAPATAAQIQFTIAAPPPGSVNYLEGVCVQGQAGTVAGSAVLTIVMNGLTYSFALTNPILGGLNFILIFPTPRQTTGTIVVTLPAMVATSGQVSVVALGYQQ